MKITAIVSVALLLLAVPALQAETTASTKDIVATARADERFETLVSAVQEAGLVEALHGKGPFTVFAPTDEAFAALPPGALAGLLASPKALRRVLGNHVVAGRVFSTDLLGAKDAKTLAGSRLPFGLRVGEANVTQADIECSNGVIHVIDRVLFPTPVATTAPVIAARKEKPVLTAAPPAPAKTMKTKKKANVLQVIHRAIDRGVPIYNSGDFEGCAREYAMAAQVILGAGDALAEWDRADIERVIDHASKDPSERAWQYRHAFDRIIENASFQPRMEAAMPPGFPKPGPVGRVVVKRYPQYRAARADGGNSFWTLFQHIKKNKVEMTAPVEMTMGDDMRMRDMAFLYEGPTQGNTGRQGRVDVLDLKPQRVLSIGIRGGRSMEMVKQAKAILEAHIEKNGMERTGEFRVLGYNSPMVPNSKKFWELQVPIAD